MVIKAIKIPVVIELIQWDGTYKGYREIKEFAQPHQVDILKLVAADILVIKTLEGNMTAGKGDYIAKGVKGEVYPINEEIFNETYKILEGEDN